jgi:Na+/H+ antiporter NhaD/arsenite permease-like protein
VGIRDARLLIISLVVLAAILAGFLFQGVFGIEPSIVAIVGGLLLLSVSGLPVREILAEVDWTTLAFFSGLFILVGTLAKTGAITTVSSNLVGFVGDSQSLSFVTVLSGSAAISSFVDNVPYVAAATPVVAHLTAAHPEHGHLLWWALSIGANLGGNATSIGASANIVAVGLAERAGERISFLHFAKYGVIVTLASLSSAAAVLWFGRS